VTARGKPIAPQVERGHRPLEWCAPTLEQRSATAEKREPRMEHLAAELNQKAAPLDTIGRAMKPLPPAG
jgi:hypothetical protein